MKLSTAFFLFSFGSVLTAGELPCDLVRKDPAYTIGYVKNGVGFCSGVLISRHLVLTAGHCVKGESVDKITFSLVPSDPSTFVVAERMVTHPTYWKAANGSAGGLDLALIILKTANYGGTADYFMPLSNLSGLSTGELMVSWGFGLQDGGEKAKRHKKAVVFSGAEDTLSSDGKTVKGGRLVFTRGETGEIQCSGDSGGPVLLQQNGKWTILGINSRSAANIKFSSKQGLQRKLASKEYFCHHSDKFFGANIGQATDWIQESIKKLETDKSLPRCGK